MRYLRPFALAGGLILVLGIGSGAGAADLPVPPVVFKAAVAVPSCTTSLCTGFYVGGGIDGNGTSADILGSGLDGSVFGGGAIPTIDAGYQLWNSANNIFFDIEAGAGYAVPVASTINAVNVNPAQKGWLAYQELQVGGKLSGLLGTSSQPITTPSALLSDLIAPYVALGVAEESGATGLETGAGAKFAITPNGVLDVGYRYIPFNSTDGVTTLKADNLVRIRFNYIFK